MKVGPVVRERLRLNSRRRTATLPAAIGGDLCSQWRRAPISHRRPHRQTTEGAAIQ
jgi:hypothetical protein